MTEQKPIMSSRAYATEYGTFLGIAWVVVFALYVLGIRGMNSLFMLWHVSVSARYPLSHSTLHGDISSILSRERNFRSFLHGCSLS